MSEDPFAKRRKALEDQYFHKENEDALKRLQKRGAVEKPRLSPVTGKPMKQVTLMGVVIDQCEDSGGVWLDPGELEELVNASKLAEKGEPGIFSSLLNSIRRR